MCIFRKTMEKRQAKNTNSKLLILPVILIILGSGMFYFGKAIASSHEETHKPEAHPSKTPHHDVDVEEEDVEEVEVPIGHKKDKKTDVINEAHADTHEKDHAEAAPKKGFFGKVFGVYGEAWNSVQFKVDELRRSDEENRRLRLENAWLRVQVENQKFTCRVDEAKTQTKTIGQRLQTETGAKTGRTLASIPYQFPENLMPEQLHALGLGYFKARDDEKAAKIFTFLTDMEDGSEFKSPQNFLLAGISWYRLENWKLAGEYFDRVMREKETTENKKYQIHARLWLALVAERKHERPVSQEWIRQTLEVHPHSIEARWVNPQAEDHPAVHKKGTRKLASEKSEPQKETHKEESHETDKTHHH